MAADDVILEVSHVLYSSADSKTGAIKAHIGDAVSGECSDDNATVFQQPGFLSLAAVPDAGVAGAECVALKKGGHDYVLGQRDVRSAEIAGLIKQGETCAYASGSQACELFKLDGSIVQFTTLDNTKDGRSIYRETSPRGFDDAWPYGRILFDTSGYHAHHVSGASFDWGSCGLPAPHDIYKSYFTLKGDLGRINTTFLSVGPDPEEGGLAPSPVAKAAELATLLAANAAALSSASSALAAVALALSGIQTNIATGGDPPHVAQAALQIGLAVTALNAASTATTVAVAGVVPVPGPIGSSSLAVM